MKDVVIVSAVRTPIGSFGGAFKDISAVNLGVRALKERYNRINRYIFDYILDYFNNRKKGTA